MACPLVPAKRDNQSGFQATGKTLLTGIAKLFENQGMHLLQSE